MDGESGAVTEFSGAAQDLTAGQRWRTSRGTIIVIHTCGGGTTSWDHERPENTRTYITDYSTIKRYLFGATLETAATSSGASDVG